MGNLTVTELMRNVDRLMLEIKGVTPRKHVRHDFQRKLNVLRLAHSHGGFVTVDDVIRDQQCSGQIARSVLSNMCRSGMLVRVWRGRYKTPGTDQK